MFDSLIRLIREWYETDDFIPLHEPRFGKADREYVMDAIDSTFVSSVGQYVDRFEEELACLLGADHAIATVNGTAALQVALNLSGVHPGNEVITQPLTFIATANTISHNQAFPVFIDVDKVTLGLSAKALEIFLDREAIKKNGSAFNKKSGRKIAAILPMHTFGLPCRMGSIIEIAAHWNIPVVEDAAEALGSTTPQGHCATLGKTGVLSFNGNKTITSGGGGAIITNNSKLARQAKHLTTTAKVSHPWKFIHDEIGYNYRMPNLNAALACAQLNNLVPILKDKRQLANTYKSHFSSESWTKFIAEPQNCKSNYWLNAIMLPGKKERDRFLEKTNAAGIMTRPIWELIPDLPMYKDCQKDNMKNARYLADRVVNLPSSARKNVC